MDHLTSTWARWYGAPDPALPADEVLAARPDQLRALADRCEAITAALRRAAGPTGRAATALREGWSAPPARSAVDALARAAARTADDCGRNAALLRDCASALARAGAAVRAAYDQAEATIEAHPMLRYSPMLVSPQADLARRRIVDALHLATDTAAVAARGAATRLYAGLGPDPRPNIPGIGSAPAGGGAAEGADAANRAALAADLASTDPAHRRFAQRVRLALRNAARISGGPVELLGYDPEHPAAQGSAAIAIGDVARADSVAVLVPGVGNSPDEMSGTLQVGASLNAAASAAAPGGSTATVVWMGYDIPGSWPHAPSRPTAVQSLGNEVLATNGMDASVGGVELADFCRRLRGEMDPSAGLTLIGHSYGSTVVSQAALRLDAHAGVSDIVLLASPGVGYGVHTAADYRAVPADHVYALAFPRDPVPSPATDLMAEVIDPVGAALGRMMGGDGSPFGPDPTAAGYGAQVIDAPSGVPVAHDSPSWVTELLTGPASALLSKAGIDPVRNLAQHHLDNYLGGAALTAVAAVVVGAYSRVPVRPRR